MNDLSAVNVGLIVRAGRELVELSNGCICCTLRDELVTEVVRLARAGSLDWLVIESTGVSEPLPVAQGFVLEVDGPSFLTDFATLDRVEDRSPDAPAEDRRNIVDLLVVNKTDLVDPQPAGHPGPAYGLEPGRPDR